MDLISPGEKIIPPRLVFLIYGQPGAGKTTIAQTAADPILLDCDAGAHRSLRSGRVAQPKTWQDCWSVLEMARGQKCRTIVVDTVSRLLDFATLQICADNPKCRTRTGNLTLEGWGALKGVFRNYLRELLSQNFDVVLLAQEKEDKRGEVDVVRPDVSGGSLGEIRQVADAIGYLHLRGNERVIRWQPTEGAWGKSPCGWGDTPVPPLAGCGGFLAGLFEDARAKLGHPQAEPQGVKLGDYEGLKLVVPQAKELKDFNQIVADARGLEPAQKRRLFDLLVINANPLGFFWDKEKKEFVTLEKGEPSPW